VEFCGDCAREQGRLGRMRVEPNTRRVLRESGPGYELYYNNVPAKLTEKGSRTRIW
jgi:hypothetical protein